MTETLRIDAPLVVQAGTRLQALAAAIPPPPTAVRPSGGDALSVAIAGKVAEVVDPVLAQLPVTKEELTRYAQNVLAAAGMYDATDRQLAEEILKRLGEFDGTEGSAGGGSGAGGAGGAGGATTAGGAGTTPSGGAATGAGAADQAGQMGQMMQMPMQMAQQAAQIPMQLAGMAGAIPAAMMQGLQSAMQQVGQVSEMAGTEDELKPEGVEDKPAEAAPEKRPEQEEPQVEGARPGTGGGERVPEAPAQEAQPQTPEAPPKPAPTRPAEAAPEIAL
ncbi:PE domain-containing protein [Mycolicibacterium pulveris]|uniref:PE domain-containing protein n=1 Tax=Mycolicibacterium pulveris TaxID=36813 RepID=UPI003CEB2BE0